MEKMPPKQPIYVVVGTRAQLIKTAPVMRELERRSLPYRFIYTAQHKETIDDIRANFQIKAPDYVVRTRRDEAKTLFLFASWGVSMMKELLANLRRMIPTPGILLTHGDTATCLWGALAGKLSGSKVMHLESGLRSFNLLKPFPEEIIRLLTFQLTDIYACPTQWALENLRRYRGVKLLTNMNTQFDSVALAVENEASLNVDLPTESYAVASIHRFENIFKRERLEQILAILNRLAERIRILFILHPPTEARLRKFGYYDQLQQNPRIELRPRYPFFEFIKLINHSEYVLTDGGSNQEELSYLGKPTLLLREVTERQEGLGRNVKLSTFDLAVIDDFAANYQAYRTDPLQAVCSPSAVIVDWLETELSSV